MDFDSTILERLLYMREGPTLDFKRERYPFNGADNRTKSELLKDILAFANSSRDGDAYILIGVKETRVGRNEVIGVCEHLDDANLHQFINSKTNRPVKFSYFPFEVDNKVIGVLRLPIQNRPVYTQKNYGDVKRNVVYMRDGSSTRPASPDEIAAMGRGNPPRWAIDRLRSLAQYAVVTVVGQWRNHPYRHSEYGGQNRTPTYKEARAFILNRSSLLEDYKIGIDSYGSLRWVFKGFEDLASHCGEMFRTVTPILAEYGLLIQAMSHLEECVKNEQSLWEEFRERTNDPNAPLPAEASYNLLAIAEVAVRLVDVLDSGNLREDPEYGTLRRPVRRQSRDWGEWRR